jgi:hypothetical protein
VYFGEVNQDKRGFLVKISAFYAKVNLLNMEQKEQGIYAIRDQNLSLHPYFPDAIDAADDDFCRQRLW